MKKIGFQVSGFFSPNPVFPVRVFPRLPRPGFLLRIKIFNNFKKDRESRIKAKNFSRIETIFENFENLTNLLEIKQIQILVDENHFAKLF